LDQEINIYQWNKEPPTALADIMHPPGSGRYRRDKDEKPSDITDVTVTRKDQSVKDCSWDCEKDCE